MKKWLIKVIMILVIILPLLYITAASADVTYVTGGSKLKSAKQIDCGIVYESAGTTQEAQTFTSYYQFVAPDDDICTVSFEVEKHYWYNFDETMWLIVAYDSNGDSIRYVEKVFNVTSESFDQKEFPCVIARIEFPVKNGETYSFLLANGCPERNSMLNLMYYKDYGLSNFYDPCGTYRFSVCLRGTHAAALPYTYTVEKEPSCTENGVEIAVCEWCGEKLDQRFNPALGHVEGEWRTEKEATCSEEGFRAVRCLTCNEILEKETLEKITHTQGKYAIISMPTCEYPGVEKAVCEICGETLSERAIDPVGHKAGEWTVQAEAGCDHEGVEIQVCSACNATVHSRAISTTPHTPGGWTQYTAPSCTTEGLEVLKCETCGGIINQRTLPATGHIPGSFTNIREATCTIDGERLQLCSVCQATLGQETVPALGHQFTDWDTVLPTEDQDGHASRFCIVCGETEIKVLKKSN